MKKKRKISYSELAGGAPEAGARGQAPAPRSQAESTAATDKAQATAKTAETKPAEKVKRTPAKRAVQPVETSIDSPSAPPVVAPEVVPEIELKRRVSSPVEIAAVLRQSPAAGIPALAEPPTPAAAAPAVPAAPTDWHLAPGIPEAPATVEDYATALARRLAAMAPPEIEEDEQLFADARPLRERLHAGEGIADLLMFRIGSEIFATELGAVEEAVSLPEIHHLPEMPAAMLGAFNLRGRLTPVYSPAHVIGVPLAGAAQAALLVSANGRRLGLAVDDVEDVFQVDLASIREAPGIDDADGILLGVAHHGQELVAVLDAEALVAACLTGHVMETA